MRTRAAPNRSVLRPQRLRGLRSERVYALLAKAPSVAVLVEHPAVLELVDAILHPNFLLSANLAINVHPGETAQMLHADDGYCRIPRPRVPMGISAIWAIDEFTEDNGATELIPGSHTWGEAGPDADDSGVQQITMPAGSAVVFMGTLLHRGGANRSNRTRLASPPSTASPGSAKSRTWPSPCRHRWRLHSRPVCRRCSATASIPLSSATWTEATRDGY